MPTLNEKGQVTVITIHNLANKGNGVRLGERAEGWEVTE